MRGTHPEKCSTEDYFCMSAVKNSISEYKNTTDTGLFMSKENWNLQPINNAFLQSVS